MPHFVVTAVSPLTPDAITAALTDFGPGRPELWPNLDSNVYEVLDIGDSQADVVEGSKFLGGIWERVHYDWSTPGRVRLEVLDGNATKPGSYWEYRIAQVTSGTTKVTLELDRRCHGPKGAVLAALLTLFGRRVFASDLRKSLARIAGANAGRVTDSRVAG